MLRLDVLVVMATITTSQSALVSADDCAGVDAYNSAFGDFQGLKSSFFFFFGFTIACE